MSFFNASPKMAPDHLMVRESFPPLTLVMPAPCFFDAQKTDSLGSILKQPQRWFIENGEYGRIEAILSELEKNPADFCISLSTPSAYHAPITQLMMPALADRFGLPSTYLMKIETCLHEAVMNALVHGNLAVRSDFHTMEGFSAYCNLIEERLHKVPYCDRRVTITVRKNKDEIIFAVSDQGSGFKMSGKRGDVSLLPHGRGLMLIKSLAARLWIGADRRSLLFSFSYERIRHA